MSMKSINFNTGIKTYSVNGDESNCISINVADPNLWARVEKAEAQIDGIIDRIKDFDALNGQEREDLDREVKEIIDTAFNADVCSHAFGNTSCFTPLANGDFLFMSFLTAFIELVSADSSKEITKFVKNSEKNAEKYMKEIAHEEVEDVVLNKMIKKDDAE